MMEMMMKVMMMLRNTTKSEKGQGMVEYGLIIGLVAIVVIVALTALSGGLNNIFGQITTALGGTAATTAAP